VTRPVGELCRLTVVAQNGQADIAVPGSMSIGEVLPTLLRSADPALANRPSPAHSWALQRIGEEPLDEESTFDALGLSDGDVLYLRPRDAPLPPIVFDDLVDGVATAIKDRPDAWQSSMTRRLFVGLAGLLLAVVWVGLLLAGPITARVGVTGVVTLGLVGGAALCSRALGQRSPTLLLGVAAVSFAATWGFLLPSIADPTSAAKAQIGGFGGFAIGVCGGPQMLSAGAVAAVVALIVLVLVDVATWVFLAALVTMAGIGLGGLLSAWLRIDSVGSAGVIGVVAFAVSVLAPTTATRLVRMRLPQLPSDEAELQEDIEPTPGREVLGISARADSYLNSLCVSTGLLCAGSVTLLARGSAWSDLLLAAVLGAGMLLRSRVMIGAWQRMAAVVPGAVATAALLIAEVHRLGPAVGPYLLLGASLLTGGLLFAASYLPNRRLLPFWGRSADVLETMVGVAAVPILLQVLHVYGWARGFSG
jgi:type VII secretion integral membrane protein EccD